MRRHISVVAAEPAYDAQAWLSSASIQRDGAGILHVAGEGEDLPRLATVIETTARHGAFEQYVLDAGAGPGIERVLGPLGANAKVAQCVTGHPEVPEDVDAAFDECAPAAVVIHV